MDQLFDEAVLDPVRRQERIAKIRKHGPGWWPVLEFWSWA